MVKQGRGGRIIGASSLAGKTGAHLTCMLTHKTDLISVIIQGWPTLTAYGSSKFAVRALTQNAGWWLITLNFIRGFFFSYTQVFGSTGLGEIWHHSQRLCTRLERFAFHFYIKNKSDSMTNCVQALLIRQ